MRPKLVYLLYRGSAEVLRTLPRPVASSLAAGLGRLSSLSVARRSVVTANLRHVVGEALSEPEMRRVVRRAFASYGRYWADAARLSPAEPRQLARRWRVDGTEVLERAASENRGVILALPHLGSWEIGALWSSQRGYPMTTVAEPAEPAELFEWFIAQREALGLTVLPLGSSVAPELLRRLRGGGVVALLADRDIAGDGIEVEFFGERTRLPAGPAALALRSGAVLAPCAVYHHPGDQHHGVIRSPIDTTRHGRLRDDVARVTQALAHELEALIRVAPEQWHVFQPNWPTPGGAVSMPARQY